MLVLEGRVFYRGRLERMALGIEDGRIVRVAKTLRGDDRRDYGDRLILPGGVDLHVHFREPGNPHKEDFSTGTAAAAAGGVTTVLDMPNTMPPVATRDAYEAKLRIARRKANVDFGLYALIRSAADVRRFSGLAPAGKLYMAESGSANAQTDPGAWRGIVTACAETGFPLVVHAEDPRKFREARANDLAGHDQARPPEAEASAIRALANAADACETPPRIHVTHIASRAALEAVAGTGFTTDATPHHALLHHGVALGPRGKVNPPLRAPEDRDALRMAMADGRIDAAASDHAPHTAEEKDVAFRDAPSGVPGVETMLPLLLRAVKAGDLSIERFVDLTATRPAEILGLEAPTLEVGRPATLLVVDTRSVAPVRSRELHSRCGWSPFEGAEAVFPHSVYLRGELAVEGRQLVAERSGRPIAPPAKG